MLLKSDDGMQEVVSTTSLRPHQNELLLLAELAGIHMDPLVFSNLVQLLNIGVSSEAVYQLLKVIRRGGRGSTNRRHRSSRSATGSSDILKSANNTGL